MKKLLFLLITLSLFGCSAIVNSTRDVFNPDGYKPKGSKPIKVENVSKQEEPNVVAYTNGGAELGAKCLKTAVVEQKYITSITNRSYSINGGLSEESYNVLITLNTKAVSFKERKNSAFEVIEEFNLQNNDVMRVIYKAKGEDYEIVSRIIDGVYTGNTLNRLKNEGDSIYRRYSQCDYFIENTYYSAFTQLPSNVANKLWQALFIKKDEKGNLVDKVYMSGIKELNK